MASFVNLSIIKFVALSRQRERCLIWATILGSLRDPCDLGDPNDVDGFGDSHVLVETDMGDNGVLWASGDMILFGDWRSTGNESLNDKFPLLGVLCELGGLILLGDWISSVIVLFELFFLFMLCFFF